MSSDLKAVPGDTQEKPIDKDQAKKPETPATKPSEDEKVELKLPAEKQEHYLGGAYSSATIRKIRKDPSAIYKLFREGKYPYTDKIVRRKYEAEKAKLQIELLKVQS